MRRIIELLIISDLALIIGGGLVSPIFAIFIKEGVIGGSIFAAGLASSLFMLTTSIFNIPMGKVTDKYNAYKEFLVLGTILMTIAAFLYAFATHVNQIYLIQILYGFGAAVAYSPWCALFSHYLDKHEEAFEWGVYKTVVGMGAAGAAALGGFVVEIIGFRYLFLTGGFMGIIGVIALVMIKKPRMYGSKRSHTTIHQIHQHKHKEKHR